MAEKAPNNHEANEARKSFLRMVLYVVCAIVSVSAFVYLALPYAVAITAGALFSTWLIRDGALLPMDEE